MDDIKTTTNMFKNIIERINTLEKNVEILSEIMNYKDEEELCHKKPPKEEDQYGTIAILLDDNNDVVSITEADCK